MKKYYLCAMAGDGTRFNQFRPALADLIASFGGSWATCYEDSDTDASTFVLAVSDLLPGGGSAAGMHEECTRQGVFLGDTFSKAQRFLARINASAANKMVDAPDLK